MKDWLLANVEKLVLGLCALLMAYLVYSGLAVKKYDKKPDDFSKSRLEHAMRCLRANQYGRAQTRKRLKQSFQSDHVAG